MASVIMVLLSSKAIAVSTLGVKNINATPFVLTQFQNGGTPGYCVENGIGKPCYRSLVSDESQWLKIERPGAWATLNYNVCTSIDYSKPDICVGYLGNVALTFEYNNAKVVAEGGSASLNPGPNGLYTLKFETNQRRLQEHRK